MLIEQALKQRSDSKCELCASESNLAAYEVPASPDTGSDYNVLLCDTCKGQLEAPDTVDVNHWRCLNDSMWSQVPAVQVMAWRQLKRLAGSGEGWAQDLADMMYMEDDQMKWAEAGLLMEENEDEVIHRDVNGTILQAGDTVHLVKDLVVKGANFTAKRGTPVRNIGLTSNPEHIEGRVNGTRIVIIAAYTKKSTLDERS